MTSIALYVEGGGDSQAGKFALRQGLDELLSPQKSAARARQMHWKTVMCGGRNQAFDAFANATKKGTAQVIALVVDAEEEVLDTSPDGRVAHLAKRDRWDLGNVDARRVHLMTQCMEAWIVADPDKLESFYGKGFNKNSLPRRTVLDDEPKTSLYTALDASTRKTPKGSYGKVKHASQLLKVLRPEVVAKRCASFKHFTKWLDDVIAGSEGAF